MSLRWRIALGFALVALATAAVVALAAPQIVSQGFSEFENEVGQGAEPPTAQPSGATAAANSGGNPAEDQQAPAPTPTGQAQQDTIVRLIVAAAGAAALASLLGLVVAGRLVRPLNRLETAAGGVARGDLTQRSGLADRSDEFGRLGRTFDSMASELQKAEETRRQFLQDTAHELRTPLTVIDATSSAILDGVYEPERRHIETIRDQSRVLARVVEDLRTISLAEGGHLPLDRKELDLGEVLSSVVAGFEARANAGGIRVTVVGASGLAVAADAVRLRQIAGALVDNALRHTPQGGTVRLGAALVSRGGGQRDVIRVAVEDTGAGIPPEALPHIFERYFQAGPSRSRHPGTSGLGLSIVRALVQAHGGSVGAENRTEGGARLWFELPAREVG
jgi:two-component system, OmpR family, sensor histidine kinase BaeS